ncbi:FadR/GntR family transcriptional regulator [Dactylosporangium sp. CA-139114]|uniref:FadR/GntR family transcriptional regulator n=1 Tax=Dactylosporangium sp. CA-139114 TaxID=3239931 RepID=UPI003D9560C4
MIVARRRREPAAATHGVEPTGSDVEIVTHTIQPVRRLKLADAVVAQLSRLITEGEYRPGDRLASERDLAKQFCVGRSTMREALRSLEADAFVRTEHGIGVFVEQRQQRRGRQGALLVDGGITVAELFEVRRPLERDAAGLAAKRISANEAAELWTVIERAAVPSISDEEFIALDGELHRMIAKVAKNAVLCQVLAGLEPLFFAYSHQVIALPNRRARAHAGHVRIVDAVTRRQPREASSAAVAHIHDVERDIVTNLDTTEQAV